MTIGRYMSTKPSTPQQIHSTLIVSATLPHSEVRMLMKDVPIQPHWLKREKPVDREDRAALSCESATLMAGTIALTVVFMAVMLVSTNGLVALRSAECTVTKPYAAAFLQLLKVPTGLSVVQKPMQVLALYTVNVLLPHPVLPWIAASAATPSDTPADKMKLVALRPTNTAWLF